VTFPRAAGVPPVSVERWTGATVRAVHQLGTHAHDFLVLLHAERGHGPMRVDDREWVLEPGDVLLVAPGAVVAPPQDRVSPDGLLWAVFFPADAVDPAGAAPLVSWRAHPLLAPYAGGQHGGAQRLRVPPAERPAWRAELAALETELAERRDGVGEAVRAHLTLLLVRLGRLEVDVPTALADRPVLAAVFDVLERRFAEPITPREIAREVGLTPGHLTTLVGRHTGRTVGQWLTERRMREARRLLVGTDLAVAAVAGRVGYRDPGYFVRRFRREHGVPPQAWRRAAP
jgi:AraC-like DNA-binding protein